MARIRQLHDLEVFGLAMDAAMRISELSKHFSAEERYSLTDQIRRCSRSVCANLAEAWNKRRYANSFISKLSDANAEAAEVQVWLEFAVKCNYLDRPAASELYAIYDNIQGKLVTMLTRPEQMDDNSKMSTSDDCSRPAVPPSRPPAISPSRPPAISPSPPLALFLSRLWHVTLDLLFPPRCVGCGRHGGAWLCERCRKEIQPILPPVCIHCGQEIPTGTACPSCQMYRPALDGLRSAAVFDGALRKAIHSFKYNGLRDLAGPLGEILAEGYARHLPPADLLIPVPLHRSRQGQRGFNQSLLLAEELSAHTGLPVLSEGLVRVRDTHSQVGLRAGERKTNVAGAFAWRGEELQGRRALLIDDVCTTGSTMEACAAALYAADATSVWGLTLARENFGKGKAGTINLHPGEASH